MIRFFKENKAQGALEYLLMIGGAIIVVLIIGLMLKNKAKDVGNQGTGHINDVKDQI